jgi:hypothetical protein
MKTHSLAAPAALVLGAFFAAAPAYVGQWHSYSDRSHVTSLIEHEGRVYAGTTGGIRQVTPSGSPSAIASSEVDYDNLDGLLDVWVQSLVTAADGSLWAVARDGFLYRLQGTRWEPFGRSYASLGWKMNARAVLPVGTRFFLGSEKGITLFDATQKVSQLNVVRFRSETDVSVLSLLRLEDTLYVGTTRGVFKAGVYFADPMNPPTGSGYGNLADPNVWIKTRTEPAPGLILSGDSVIAAPAGTRLAGAVPVTAVWGSPLSIAGHAHPADWNDFTSAVVVAGRVFAGGDRGLYVSVNPADINDAAILSPLRAYPRDTIYNVSAVGGKVWGHSPRALVSLNPDGSFRTSPANVLYSDALITRDIRGLQADRNGDVYIATWGTGLNRVQEDALRLWTHATDDCLYQAFPPTDPWTVAAAMSAPHDGGVWFTVFRTEGSADHQLAYLETSTGTVYCPDGGTSVPGGYPRAVHAFSNTLLGIASDRGLSLFETQKSFSGPTLVSKALWTTSSGGVEAWDLATGKGGRPWALIGGTLASLDVDSLDLSTAHHLKSAENFSGEDCKNLASDASGTLWAGCANGLFSIATSIDGGIGAVRRYGLDDGLLSLSIRDIAVDTTTGQVWVATDRGVSLLEGEGVTPVPNGTLAGIVPYPNPFKSHHRFVIFDHLPRNSTLRIHNAAGTVVRTFRPADLTGNQAQWDGKNEDGKAVSAGVYLFSVVSGSTIQRGKVIVAR